MTISKGGSQETSGNSRNSSNSLNPDAPEFNPTSKSGGKLNADAPEFVPGQLPQYDPLMLNVSDIKGGYKNGHMSGYRLSHQEQFVPVWLSQPYSVPYQQMFPNGPYEYIPYDYTRQTQNYPIQRNVYPNAVHNEYPLNMPYNVVVQGKSKLGNKAAKARAAPKDSPPSKDSLKEKDSAAISVRDNVSVATTKDTTRDPLTSVRDLEPQPPKPLTWAERTKLSTTRQLQKPAAAPAVAVPPAAAATQAKAAPAPEPSVDGSRDPKVQPSLKGAPVPVEPPVSAAASHVAKAASQAPPTEPAKVEDEPEQISYAKVFKEAVRSTTLGQTAVDKEAAAAPSKPVSDPKLAKKPDVSTSEPQMSPPKQDLESAQPSAAALKSSSSVASQDSTASTRSFVKEAVDVPATQLSTAISTEASREDTSGDHTTDYSVDLMLKYYVYLLSNKNMVDEIRDKFNLPHIKFTTITSSTTPVKSGFKDRDRDRSDKLDKKDWRHKSYDKNFGNNFRFNNKDFTRSDPPQPAILASEGSWLMKQAKQKKDKDVILRRKIIGLLNRLTFEKFDVIYNQIIDCGIDTPEHAEMLVKFVFDKAVTQHHFIPMYVELCAKLAIDLYTIDGSSKQPESKPVTAETTHTPDTLKEADSNATADAAKHQDAFAPQPLDQAVDPSSVEAKSESTATASKLVSVHSKDVIDPIELSIISAEIPDVKSNRRSDFMRILLSCSQDSFEDNLKPLEIPEELEGDDRFEYELKYKHKMRGNMMFVGELFKQKLLAAKLLITCLDQVFLKREECILLYNDVNMGNNHLEAMCTLLQTVGRSFDTSRWKLISDFEKRIQHLEDLGKNEQISFRIRCLIKNVLDSRLDHWDKSIYQKQDQPCKLQELRHKHTGTSFSATATNSKSDKQDPNEEVWRMRSKKKSGSTSANKSEKHRKEASRAFGKESERSKQSKQDMYDMDIRRQLSSDHEDMRRDLLPDQNSDDQELIRDDLPPHSSDDELAREHDQTHPTYSEHELDNGLDKLSREVKSILNELALSHDTEESTLRVDELNLTDHQLNDFYRLLVVVCMETCSKLNAEKQAGVVTDWMLELASARQAVDNLVNGLHAFVFGTDESCMDMLVDDFPLMPQTLKLLVEKMRLHCHGKDKFQQVLAHI